MSTRPPTEVSPLVHKERSPPPTQRKMTFKFTLVALAFQLVLLILFGTITNYGKFSSPPGKNDTLKAENEIRLYYPSKWFVLNKFKPASFLLTAVFPNIKRLKTKHLIRG